MPKKLSKRNGPPDLESFFLVICGGRKWVSGVCSQEFPQFWPVLLWRETSERERERDLASEKLCLREKGRGRRLGF